MRRCTAPSAMGATASAWPNRQTSRSAAPAARSLRPRSRCGSRAETPSARSRDRDSLADHRLNADHLLAGLASNAGDGLVPHPLGDENERPRPAPPGRGARRLGGARPTGNSGPACVSTPRAALYSLQRERRRCRSGRGRRESGPALPRLRRLQNSITLRIPSCASISSNPRLTSSSGMRCEMNGSTSISPAM